MKHHAQLFVLALAAFLLWTAPALCAERVLVVGDEFVLGAGDPENGFIQAANKALQEKEIEVVPLGKDRAVIGDWRAALAKIANAADALDEESQRIKAEFDKGADYVFVYLGANDIKKPTFTVNYSARTKEEDPSVDALKNEYAAMIDDLRKLAPNAKRIVLACPQTYEFQSWNLHENKFRTVVEKLAEEKNCERLIFVNGNLGTVFEMVKMRRDMDSSGIFHDADYDIDRQARISSYPCRISGAPLDPTETRRQNVCAVEAFLLALNPNLSVQESLRQIINQQLIETTKDPQLLPENLKDFKSDPWSEFVLQYRNTEVKPAFDLNKPALLFATPQIGVRACGIAANENPDVVSFSLQCVPFRLSKTEERSIYRVPSGFRSRVENQPEKEFPQETAAIPNFQFNGPEGLVHKGTGIKLGSNDYVFQFEAPKSIFPFKITVKTDETEEQTIEIRSSYQRTAAANVAAGFRLDENATFTNADDYPKKASYTALDDSAVTGTPPTRRVCRTSNGGAAQWTFFFKENEDADLFNLKEQIDCNAFDAAYIVRHYQADEARKATLRLGAVGATHVVERVFLNGRIVFFGELNGEDQEKSEKTVEVNLKKGDNIVIARVDHDYWDWIVRLGIDDMDGTAETPELLRTLQLRQIE